MRICPEKFPFSVLARDFSPADLTDVTWSSPVAISRPGQFHGIWCIFSYLRKIMLVLVLTNLLDFFKKNLFFSLNWSFLPHHNRAATIADLANGISLPLLSGSGGVEPKEGEGERCQSESRFCFSALKNRDLGGGVRGVGGSGLFSNSFSLAFRSKELFSSPFRAFRR